MSTTFFYNSLRILLIVTIISILSCLISVSATDSAFVCLSEDQSSCESVSYSLSWLSKSTGSNQPLFSDPVVYLYTNQQNVYFQFNFSFSYQPSMDTKGYVQMYTNQTNAAPINAITYSSVMFTTFTNASSFLNGLSYVQGSSLDSNIDVTIFSLNIAVYSDPQGNNLIASDNIDIIAHNYFTPSVASVSSSSSSVAPASSAAVLVSYVTYVIENCSSSVGTGATLVIFQVRVPIGTQMNSSALNTALTGVALITADSASSCLMREVITRQWKIQGRTFSLYQTTVIQQVAFQIAAVPISSVTGLPVSPSTVGTNFTAQIQTATISLGNGISTVPGSISATSTLCWDGSLAINGAVCPQPPASSTAGYGTALPTDSTSFWGTTNIIAIAAGGGGGLCVLICLLFIVIKRVYYAKPEIAPDDRTDYIEHTSQERKITASAMPPEMP